MVAAAELLARDMDFVRGDCYATKDRIYFGEFTSTPGNGVVRYVLQEFDMQPGQLWNMR